LEKEEEGERKIGLSLPLTKAKLTITSAGLLLLTMNTKPIPPGKIWKYFSNLPRSCGEL
jgi:hypothetical protein